MGAGCGLAPMPLPTEGIDAAVRLIQKICAEYNLDPAQWLHGEKIEDLIAERDEAVALAAMWHESCTGKHGSQMPCVSPVKTGAPRCEAQSPGFFSKRCDLSHGHDGSHVATKDGVTDKWPSNPPLCPTCKTELAFEGDVCGLCFPVAQP
jgi:hypothetical protein